ncbi:hypothetical protein J2Z35_001211 [Acetoanaerobium pronyense]|uniref:Recombinase n=1 Tax=Acetoanaerobium pronyense TaxID=1482736 RepID=A0ABS4KI06_9FIRM|nr:hypothetical protein [Acetoanaerobium pronyense]MBP2027417.1 hypothetical protein [Acetoanaerobium pronyense]
MTQSIENTRMNKSEYRKMMKNRINSLLELEKGNLFQNVIFSEYIKQKGAKNLVEWLQYKGYKINTSYKGRKWNTTDIRNYVLDPQNHKGVNEDIVKIVCLMVNYTGKSSFEQRLFRAMKTVLKI